MGLYSKKGLYKGYKKNNAERSAQDYYATPPIEVENILNILNYNFNGKSILDPCVGGGHMMNGVLSYLSQHTPVSATLTGTDIQDRGYRSKFVETHYGEDFLADDYNHSADIVIMNPPYATLEPFLIRGLEVAKEKLIVLCRTQALEGVGRYENVFKENPPNEIYQYVDRIKCWKNGVNEGAAIQAYCWLIWDKQKAVNAPSLFWIRRKGT